jgi:hypothetical protein
MKPAAPKPRLWPRWAIGPLGNRAIFHCAGDIPPKWKLETPLPGEAIPEPAHDRLYEINKEVVADAVDAIAGKRKPGRPRKDAA